MRVRCRTCWNKLAAARWGSLLLMNRCNTSNGMRRVGEQQFTIVLRLVLACTTTRTRPASCFLANHWPWFCGSRIAL